MTDKLRITNKNYFPLIGVFFIVAFHSLILSKITFFPYPELFLFPYLVSKGFIPYIQIIDQHFPGLLFLPVNFSTLGMTTILAAKGWLIGVIVINQLLLYLVSRIIFKDWKKAMLPSFIYLLWQPFFDGGTLWIDVFLTPFFLASFLLVLLFLKKKRYLLLSGVGFLLGVALLFKQTSLILILALVCFLLLRTKSIKAIGYLMAGFLFPVVGVLVYFLSQGLLSYLWEWSIVFNIDTYSKYAKQGINLLEFKRVIYFFAPLVAVPFCVETDLIILIFIFAITPLVEAFSRFSYVYLQPVIPFVSLSLVLVYFNLSKKFKLAPFLFALYFVVLVYWLSVFYRFNISNRVILFDDQTVQISQKIKSLTYPGEEIFLLGVNPHVYFLSKTIPPNHYFVYQLPWYMLTQQRVQLDKLKSNPPNLVVMDTSAQVDGKILDSYAGDLIKYIEDNYKKTDNIGSVNFYELNK